MSMLNEQLLEAQQRWKNEASSLLRYRWKQFQEWGQAGDFEKMEKSSSFFVDSVCTWITLPNDDEVRLAPQILNVDREAYVLMLLLCAAKAPRSHILQYLLSLGAFDSLIVQNLESNLFFSSPMWLKERIVAILSTSSVVEFGIYRDRRMNIELDPFEIGIYPITQALYELIKGENPSRFYGLARPVESVTWFDAIRFCNDFSKHAQLEPAYTLKEHQVIWNTAANGYRLPTEKEWWVAATAGQSHIYDVGDTWEGFIHCNVENFLEGTRIVGALQPNPWGLYDCSGNIFEWCWDIFQPSKNDMTRIPREMRTRIRKGGGWNSSPEACRLDYTSERRPEYATNNTGFRVVRSL